MSLGARIVLSLAFALAAASSSGAAEWNQEEVTAVA